MESVNRKITYRMYPNKEQETLLLDTLGLHWRVYNTLLDEHKRRYDLGLPSYSFKLMCKDLTKWRKIPSLGGVNAQSLQVTAKRVSLAFQSFFRRVKNGEEPGYPRFKALKRYPGWGYKTHGDGWRLYEGEKRTHALRISGIGNIQLRGKGRFVGKPKTCEIIRKQDKWYVSITFDVAKEQIARTHGNEIGSFDWGVATLLTIAKADGSIETIDNPKFLQKSLAALKKLQQVVSVEELRAKALSGLAPGQPIPKGKKLPATPKLKRLYQQVASLHSRVSRQRHDFYHKLSAMLVSRFAFLATEELDAKEMVKRPKPVKNPEPGEGKPEYLPNGAGRKSGLNRNILDAAPAMLLSMIGYKAEEADTRFELADTISVKPTQRCHHCGALVKKELNERWHTCPECYTHCGRDENAALTLLRWLNEGYFWLGTSQVDCHYGSQQETLSIAA